MLNIISVDEMPNEKQIDQAERLLFLTMEATKDYVVNEKEGSKSIYANLMMGLLNTLRNDSNFPDDVQEVEHLVNVIFQEYLEKGMPSGKLDDTYNLMVLRMTMALACNKEVMALCKKAFN
ncbi:hypothetical protein ACWN8P_14520 [Vagococcus salmoninarum]|uniref:Uncharacterized protein n=1 Tax=Vagococcus salmoninarum TaxID=2739 RepID=A0A429ZVK8_9ENTE|nr:hypothetical protein [Vagococcus salmoninarum]RST97740.1 hypothetical protein CBF35_00165 [Vagococcus salmoninarum]RST98001.1 hypothetical protein CBF35_01545 [Vagococcus salmoninarum]